MREFLKAISKKLQIGVQNAAGEVIGQGGIATFSNGANIEINLQQSRVPGAFIKAVEEHPGRLLRGKTRTDLGLKEAEKLIEKARGFREDDPDVKRVLVVITDGEQTPEGDFKTVSEAIKPFYKKDMDVYAIGVGIDKTKAITEIESMVKNRERGFAVFRKKYSDLTKEVDDFVQKFLSRYLLIIHVIEKSKI